MRFYELVFIVKQDASASHVDSIAKQYIELIEKYGGHVTKTEFCGLRTLAYPIKKNRRGHYVLINVAVDVDGLNVLKEQLRLNEDILRHLFVRVDKLDDNPSPLMQKVLKDDTKKDMEG